LNWGALLYGLEAQIVGKTTMLTLLARETVRQGNKVFFFNGEQTKDDFKNNLYKASVTKDDIFAVRYKDTEIYDYYVKPDKQRELDAIYGDKIIVFNNNSKRDIDTLLLAMKEAYELEDVKCFILDNFMQIDIEGDNVYQEQTRVMEKLRTFAVNKNVHIHLVAHPRKIENYQTRLSLYDVAGSMNIPNKAYNIISIIRKSTVVPNSPEYNRLKVDMYEEGYDFERSDGVLEILKTKGTTIGLIGLTFDKTLKTYVMQEKMTSLEYAQLKEEITFLQSNKKKCSF
jgi:DNA polymerase III delta prime subunit